VYKISKSIDFNEIIVISNDFTDFKMISLISDVYNYPQLLHLQLRFNLDFCDL